MAKRKEGPSEVARRLADLIDDAPHTEEQIGKKLGRSRTAVYEWKAGRSEPDLTTFAALCRLLNASADELLGVTRGDLPAAPTREQIRAALGHLLEAQELLGGDEWALALASRARRRSREKAKTLAPPSPRGAKG